jgi:hypothetical protein
MIPGTSHNALDEAIAKASQSAAYQIAEAYAGRGEPDQAFECLERAYRQRDGGLTGLRRDPLLISLHTDPRYKALLRKINLPGVAARRRFLVALLLPDSRRSQPAATGLACRGRDDG